MQNCLTELNLTYCLIYLDNIVIFSQTAEEHLHHLHIVLTDLENTTWNWSHWSATFLGKKSPIWHIQSQWPGCDPVIWTWRPLQSACYLKLTPRCMPFLVWLATMGGSLRGLHALHCHSTNIWLEKEPAGNQSGCHFQKMPWRISKHWNRHVWQLPFWLLLTTPNHSCWKLMCPRMDWGQCCCRSKQTDDTTPSPMAAEPLHHTRITITWLSLSF